MVKKNRSRGVEAGGEPARDDARPGGPSLDEVLGRLEAVVAELEAGDLPLEEALRRFEEGVKLARHGNGLLDAVEQRVEMLLADGDGTTRFEEEGDEDGSDDQ